MSASGTASRFQAGESPRPAVNDQQRQDHRQDPVTITAEIKVHYVPLRPPRNNTTESSSAGWCGAAMWRMMSLEVLCGVALPERDEPKALRRISELLGSDDVARRVA